MERSQEEFERISRSIKKEMEMFDCNRVKDFKDCIVKYLETLMSNQQKVGSLNTSWLDMRCQICQQTTNPVSPSSRI